MGRRSKPELAALAVLAYGPFLLSSPGRVASDSKQDLYLDPGRFLARAADLWDPHLGAGGVPHQNLGYLFPIGPWYWAFEQLGVPDWVAQRLWLGTLSLAAALGARWLLTQLGTGRAGALAGALVYALSPYQLAFTARMSVLLLPWAALPWLVGLTMRATRERGWRAPALAGLVLLAAGGINASSLVLVGLAPLLWIVLEAARARGVRVRAVLAGAGRVALVAVGISAWWLVGLRVQGTHGLPVLQLTEDVRTVSVASTPDDVLRGLGNWFFYGRDRIGYSIEQADDYAGTDNLVVALSYLVPAVALAAGLMVRWAHRTYFALLVAVGTVVAVGAWPFDDPSPYGSAWKAFTSETSVGLALRNSPRVVPIVVLGLAGLLAAAVGALPTDRRRWAGAGAVALIAGGALLPVWRDGYLSEGVERPEELPEHWVAATDALDAGDPATRVLEVPGSSFAAYQWGTTVDPVTPALIDRPYLAREVLPSGTPPSANLVAALDRRMQLGTFEPASLPALARLLGVGTVVLRADLDRSGRFDTPPPGPLWDALRERSAGLAAARPFGPAVEGDGADGVPAVALFEVEDPRPVVRTAPVTTPVLLAGDGDGIIDAAAAGLLDGTTLVLPATALDDRSLEAALDEGAHLVVTDTHRRRSETWFYALRDNRGPTERAGETAPDPTGYDFRLDPFPGSTDDSRTVAEHEGGTAEATTGGGPERPEDRAVLAFDGDPTTAWRAGGPDPRGESVVVMPAEPVAASEVRLVQPPVPEGGRSLARVRVAVPGAPAVEVDLGPASRTPPGQAVALPVDRVERLQVTILETDPPSPTAPDATPVGFAEITVGDLRIDEVIRPPVDLLARAGGELVGHGLDVVLTRLRLHLPGTDRRDEEASIQRRIELPVARTFALHGTVHPGTGGPGGSAAGCRDDVLRIDDEPVPVRVGPASTTLQACAPVALDAGSHRITTTRGPDLPVVDRLVLSSGPDGAPAPLGVRGDPAGAAGAQVEVRSQDPSELRLDVETDGTPFWLVLGQSHSDGWRASIGGAAVGDRQLVDGYANGWLVSPERAGSLDVTFSWAPQRTLWWGWAVSGVALAGCLAALWRGRRRRVPVGLAHRPVWAPWLGGPVDPAPLTAALAASASVAAAGLLVATPAMAVVAALVTLGAARLPRGPAVLVLVAPVALLVARAGHRPSIAWLAVAALVADLLLAGRRPPARAISPVEG